MMVRNYILMALRTMRRNKAYSFINIFGLALGMTCCILIMLYVQDEMRYDVFHENADRIYRVTREFLNNDGATNLWLARVAPPVGPLLANDFPGIIQEETRVLADYTTFLQVGEKSFVEGGFFWAEKNFFSILSFRLVTGDPKSVLAEPNEVVLTQSSAKRLFGNEDPIGKMIRYEHDVNLKVTGIVADLPSNSHFKFDFLGSFPTLYHYYKQDDLMFDWGSNNYVTYLLLSRNVKPETLEGQFPAFIDRHLTQAIQRRMGRAPERSPSLNTRLHLQKLADIHLHSHLTTELEENGDIVTVYLLSAIAFFILLIACINFMNLATARSAKRAREIGMRKVLGAYRRELMQQFFGESLFTSFLALLVAVVLVEIALPSFNTFVSKDLALNLVSNPLIGGGLLILTIAVGLLAGSYPALFLSSFQPVTVLKGNTVVSRRSLFRTALVVSQFTISITLFICMAVVYQQMEYVRNKPLGYEKGNIVVLRADRTLVSKIDVVRTELMSNPDVLEVSASNLIPTDHLLNSYGATIIDNGKVVPLTFRLAAQEVDHHFFDTYRIHLESGRTFSRSFGTDDTAAFVLNESAARRLGWTTDNAVGREMTYGNRRGRVIGVVQDFNFESLHNEIVPILFFINRANFGQVSVRISGRDVPATLRFLKTTWEKYRPDYPFDYSFLDQRFDLLYKEDEKTGQMFGVFSALAVFIACLGLFGLASFMAEQRTKEIGVRKVLGARIGGIALLFSREFLLLVSCANLVAWPVAYYAMSRWLSTFAYHESVSPSAFIGAGLAAMVIALATVSYQSIRAAIANPVDALRYE